MQVTLVLLIANVAFSLYGFSRQDIFQKYMFRVGPIVHQREYVRMISSGFLHGGWGHLFMNMFSLYFMGESLERLYGLLYHQGGLGHFLYLGLYMASLIGGSLLALAMHRRDSGYAAVGASGAVSGVIFACVAAMPNAGIMIYFIPMPMWLFAILYMAYTLFGMGARMDNIGHEAHMGGALVGLFAGALISWRLSVESWPFILGLGVPTMLILYFMYRNPLFAANPLAWFKDRMAGGGAGRTTNTRTTTNSQTGNPFDQRVKQDGLEQQRNYVLQKELDALLDKVNRKGYHNLSATEQRRLEELSNYLKRNNDRSGGQAPQG